MDNFELKTGYVAELSNGQCLICMRVNESKYTKVLTNCHGGNM